MSEDTEEDIHPHCLGCIKLKKCNARPDQGIGCEIVACHLMCGMSFHRCKKKEHRLLCLHEKVPCYNAENGCPCIMQRKFLASHLTVCPASIIHCTMEWYRWYIDPNNELKLRPCTDGTQLQQPQFDVALALRDQRMLKQFYADSKRSKNILCNFLKIHPARLYAENYANIFPCSEDTTRTEASAAISTSPDTAPPGLQQSVCNQLYQTYESWHNELLTALSGGNFENESLDEMKILGNGDDENKENWVNSMRNRICSQCNRLYHKDLSSNLSSSYCDCLNVNGVKEDLNAVCDIDPSDKVKREKTLCLKDGSNIIYFDEDVVSAIMSFPTRYLGSGMEGIGYSPKHTSYTFLCCQEFRRDEYPWHYKNVHSEIHGGLNGWLQERCPLAQYGCTFSRQRLHPQPKGAKIVYNEILESFGLAPAIFDLETLRKGDQQSYNQKEAYCEEVHLSLLPFELLQHIGRMLDSFSLSNLALTSSLMRDVCQSLLVERGIVSLHWQKQHNKGSTSWKVTHKHWFYSSHFTPIKDWLFDDCCSMSNHLKNCPYFDRNRKTKPQYFPMGRPPNKAIYKKMTDSMPDMNSSCENISTKL